MKNQFGNRIRELREANKLLQRQVASILEIDTPMLSKIERGERPARRAQVIAIAKVLSADEKELLTLWLVDKIIEVLENEKKLADEALKIAQNLISSKKG